MFSKILSAAVCGIESCLVYVEADVSDGMPLFSMVGYLASEVREAKDRVKTALNNSGIRIPPKRITVNLAPADLRKEGSGFDLPIAAAILASLGYIPTDAIENVLLVGELSLNGTLNPVNGVLSIVTAAKEHGCTACLVPEANSREGAVVKGIDVIGIKTISEAVAYFGNKNRFLPAYTDVDSLFMSPRGGKNIDFSEIHGQEPVKRAMEVAAAGMHNILMIGPPGAGKTMAAKRIPTILPPLTLKQSIELSKIYSVSGMLPSHFPLVVHRPFRNPHHTVTAKGLSGGGNRPKPGEVSLSHYGVLFLDELAEFQKPVLEILRQPVEDGQVQITRADGSFMFPANFMLVAALNPCPCGYYPDMDRCSCTQYMIRKYLNKISQPLLDRIDLCVEVSEVKYSDLVQEKAGESSADIRKRIVAAHEIQRNRFRNDNIYSNTDMSSSHIEKYCNLEKEQRELIEKAFQRLNMSARAYHRIIKVARTIADLDSSQKIESVHINEAICYRALDKKYWTGDCR